MNYADFMSQVRRFIKLTILRNVAQDMTLASQDDDSGMISEDELQAIL